MQEAALCTIYRMLSTEKVIEKIKLKKSPDDDDDESLQKNTHTGGGSFKQGS